MTFYFRRRWDLKACLIPFRLYINGNYIGSVNNGKILTIETDNQEKYLLEIDAPFGAMGFYQPDMNKIEINIEIQTIGGWKTPATQILVKKESNLECVLNRSITHLLSTDVDEILTPQAVLSLCWQFWRAVHTDFGEILCTESVLRVAEALAIAGALEYAKFMQTAVGKCFGGISLPLNEEEFFSDEMQNRADEMEALFAKFQAGARFQFIRAIAKYILEHELYKS